MKNGRRKQGRGHKLEGSEEGRKERRSTSETEKELRRN